jgi:hypothetical protein
VSHLLRASYLLVKEIDTLMHGLLIEWSNLVVVRRSELFHLKKIACLEKVFP